MKTILSIFALLSCLVLSGCRDDHRLKNETRAAGYAMGERIELRFSIWGSAQPPDSISVMVLEKKTGYEYSDWAYRDTCGAACFYSCIWDGRKPDGRWPAGGRYLVYAVADTRKTSFSDTVTIGLTD